MTTRKYPGVCKGPHMGSSLCKQEMSHPGTEKFITMIARVKNFKMCSITRIAHRHAHLIRHDIRRNSRGWT
eukprot:13990-Amorphochlora_amoeboformis.AAC.3